ncbi:helix-turn-helix domain-containing protein [Coraliomargarita sp. W4R72]
MSWDDESPRYVTVAQRKLLAAQQAKELVKQGYILEPLGELKSRTKIASSFWGRSWCRHLESFSDYENRLPRGRSYVRNGAILHLGIEPGKISAMVQGSELYELSIDIDPLPGEQWTAVKAACQGKIATLIELLQGKISDEIMTVVTDPSKGLFPQPQEIHFNCNCPDWADMCKHVAAVLYGVGARLDDSPELLFTLRGVDLNELISLDTTQQTIASGSRRSRRRTLSDDAVSDVFGIADEEENNTPPPEPQPTAAEAKPAPRSTTVFSPTAANIRDLRERLGLSKTAFAKMVGASAPTISNWERKTGELMLQPKHREALEQLSRQ